MINEPNIKQDAVSLVVEFDAGQLSWAVERRTATELAGFWLESQFARVDEDCDWDDQKCGAMFDAMAAELAAMGLPV